MTALKKYQRLEAIGSWRASPQEDPREVVVSIGDSTLVIRSPDDRPITHWSLAAIERFGVSHAPAIFHPDGDPTETLELAEEEAEMVMAIETLRKAVLKSRPRPVRLRWLGSALVAGAFTIALVFWLPDAVKDHTLKVVPDVTKEKIGKALQTRIEYTTGTACQSQPAIPALKTLAKRMGVAEITVLRSGLENSLYLPGGKVLVHRKLVEEHNSPDVVAGYILAARTGHEAQDSLEQLLDHVGLRATLTLLTTGFLPAASLDAYAHHLLGTPRPSVDDTALREAFLQAGVNSAFYARASETALLLQDKTTPPALLREADWQKLKDVCKE